MSTDLDWFSTYLRTRWFKVKIGDKFSSNKKLAFSVPQVFCADAKVFTAHSSTLSDEVPSHLSLNMFADDHSIKKEFHANDREDELYTIKLLEVSMVDIKTWMDLVCLKLNSSKTVHLLCE